ncbi:MAG TPA: tetratricopeptide repeat protein [Polyangia bacterium]|nr:tetratricopeptide repeat protein [Polyangia bacterium]
MALLGLVLFVAGLCLVPLQETDLFFRLANGEEILRTGHVPGRNLFSFTFPDQPYLDSAWLFDLATAGLYRLGGFPAVVAGKTAIVVATFVAAYLLVRRRNAGRVIAALVLAAAAFCMRERLVERPHVLSLLGEVAVLSLLPALQDGRRRAWLLVPVVALWANLHAGAFVGPSIVALAGLGLAVQGIITPSLSTRRAVFNHALAAMLCTLALMATPVGPGIFRYLTFHADIFAIHPVDEFRPLAWGSDAPLAIYAGALALSLGLCAVLHVRPRLRDLLPVVGLAVLAGRHVRFGADFALLAAILAAPSLTAVGARWATRLAPGYLGHFERATGALLALLALVPRVADVERRGRFMDIEIDRANLPLAALYFVDQHGLRERMYNDFETGAFLIWQGYPRHRVFVDPRLPAYPREFHQVLGRSEMTRDEWTRTMDHFGVTSALLDYAGINRRVAWWDPGEWALVFRAQDTRVFVRRLPSTRELIASYEIPASFSFTAEEGSATIPLATPPAGSPVPLCEWQLRLGDLLFDLDRGHDRRALDAYRQALAAPSGCLAPEREAAACAWLGAIDRSAGRSAQALALFDRSLAITPDDTAVLSNQALALEALARPREAAQAWSRIAALAAGSPLGDRARERARSLTRD